MKIAPNNATTAASSTVGDDAQPTANAARPAGMNLFSADTMGGRRAVSNATQGSGTGTTGGRQSMEDLLARMGATDKKKQAFDIASEAASNVIKGGFKGAGEALGGISGAADALGGVGKALGSIMGMVQNLMPIIGAVMSFF